MLADITMKQVDKETEPYYIVTIMFENGKTAKVILASIEEQQFHDAGIIVDGE